MCLKYIFIVLGILSSSSAFAGGKEKFYLKDLFTGSVDTNFIIDYANEITCRTYLSRKFTNFIAEDRYLKQKLDYNPNDRLLIGVGATYKWFTLNIGLAFPFINDDDEKYGKTEYTDLQFHAYMRKFVLDFYLQYYDGYYLANPYEVLASWNSDHYPIRDDIYTLNGGFNLNYIFNHRKFSYRAPYVQNEWQHQSAGTFLLGPSYYRITVKADKSLIPSNIADTGFYRGYQFYRTGLSNVSVNAGYAYTFVFVDHIFINFSLSLGLGFGHNMIYPVDEAEDEQRKYFPSFNTTGRMAFGYNSRKWYAGFFFVSSDVNTRTPISDTRMSFGSGMMRFNLVRRIGLKNPPGFLKRLS